MRTTLTLAFIAVAGAAFADPFSVTGPGGSVPDNNTSGFTSNATWGGTPGTVTSLISVTLTTFAHTWVGDLRVWVEHGGQMFTLFQRPLGDAAPGSTVGDSSNMTGTYTFDLTSATTLEQASTGGTSAFNIPAGSYRAAHQTNELATTVGVNSVLSDGTVFNGLAVTGNWTLRIVDGAGGDLGTLQSWTLNGTYAPVPEPATMVALAAGLGAAVLRRRRK